MAKIGGELTQGGSPSLKPEDFDGAAAGVGTVASADVRTSRFGGSKLVLRFDEWPDRELWLSKGEARTIVARYGDDTDRIVGQKVPLVCINKTVGNRNYHTVDVAPAEEWDAMLSRGKTAAKKPK